MPADPRLRKAPLTAALALALLLSGCSGSSAESGGTTTTSDITCDPAAKGSAVPFVSAAKDWGLDFTHHTQTPYCDIRDTVGGPGVCAFDYDGDGDVDLYFTDRAPHPNRLYRNDGGKLTDVTDQSGAGIVNDSHCCLAFDFDGDGDLDLFAGSSGADKLLRNDGGKFTDVTDAAGFVETGYSTTATAGDIDGDGDLDLFVGHLVTPSTCPDPSCSPSPKACKAEKNSLFVNDGGGKFHEAAEEHGLFEQDPTLASLFFDFDLDGDLDLYVGNDIGQSNPDRLYKNDGKGFFHDAAPGLGLTLYGTDTMGVDVGDTDGDGRTDLVITDFRLSPTRLVRCPNPNLNCQMLGISEGSSESVKWGVALADFDHDRDLDIFTVSGNVEVPDGYPGDLHQLHWNDGTGSFTLHAPSSGEALAERHIGRGAAFADLDGDLDLDVIIANAGQPAQILINQAASGHALLVELDSLSAGARVTVEGKDVKRLEHALIGGSYAGSSDPRVHFGLGETCAVDVTVEWPGGAKKTVPGVRAGQSIRVERP